MREDVVIRTRCAASDGCARSQNTLHAQLRPCSLMPTDSRQEDSDVPTEALHQQLQYHSNNVIISSSSSGQLSRHSTSGSSKLIVAFLPFAIALK
jgi:hypothetical protein